MEVRNPRRAYNKDGSMVRPATVGASELAVTSAPRFGAMTAAAMPRSAWSGCPMSCPCPTSACAIARSAAART